MEPIIESIGNSPATSAKDVVSKSNCLIFAMQHWLKCGGYLIIRKSHYGWWWHFLWSKDLKSFDEYHPLRKKDKRWLPPLLYKGYIRHTGTADEQSEKPVE